MNKTYFIDEVKRLVNEKTADELRKAVLKIARFIERGAREDVLEILNQQKLTLDVTEAFDLLAEVEKLLREVEEGQYEVGWGEYGVYDYYSDDDTLYDPNGLNGRLEDLLKLSIDYVKQKRYEEAYKAFEGLCAICIPNEDYDDITLSNFSDEWDMSLTEKDVYKFYACTVLVVLKDEERLDKLYEILSEVYFGINIADIAAIVNDEIPERSVFGRQWIDYLMDCELHQREHVLIEAVLFDGGLQGLHTFAKAHGVINHAIVYRNFAY